MRIIRSYYYDILRYDFLTKFNYLNCLKIPSLNKIVLSFNVTHISLRHLLPSLTALYLISYQKPVLHTKNRIKLTVKVKSGNFVSCKVVLRNNEMFTFLEKFIFLILPKIKEFNYVIQHKIVRFKLDNLFLFKQIEKEYDFFQNLPNLNVSIFFRSSSESEIAFFLSALKFSVTS